MRYLSVLFILTSLYSIINFSRLNSSVINRVYKNKIQVYLDLVFYFVEFFYFIWLTVVSLLSFHSTIFLLFITLLSWIFLKSKNYNNNLVYQSLKIIGLILILLQVELF